MTPSVTSRIAEYENAETLAMVLGRIIVAQHDFSVEILRTRVNWDYIFAQKSVKRKYLSSFH
jgi:hypothetical protein